MADTKVSALSAASAVVDANEFPINEAGVSKKVTALQLKAYSGNSLGNAAHTASQVVTAATLTYLTNSSIAIPVGKIRIGTVFRWRIAILKSAAGTAANSFHVRLGTAGTTADATIFTFTTGLGTAVADQGVIDIMVHFRGPLSASCIAAGLFVFDHNLAATGHLVIPTACIQLISGSIDVTVANLIIGLSVTSGAAVAYTVQQILAEAKNL